MIIAHGHGVAPHGKELTGFGKNRQDLTRIDKIRQEWTWLDMSGYKYIPFVALIIAHGLDVAPHDIETLLFKMDFLKLPASDFLLADNVSCSVLSIPVLTGLFSPKNPASNFTSSSWKIRKDNLLTGVKYLSTNLKPFPQQSSLGKFLQIWHNPEKIV